MSKSSYSLGFAFRVLVKAGILFVVLNLLFALLDPLPLIGRISIYNRLVPGRERLSFGEDDRAYNLSLNNLNAMFASHVIAQPKAPEEFRIVIIGDSGTWGILQQPQETLTGMINASEPALTDGRRARAYNLGHPIMSLTKDLLLLYKAMQHDPDMVIWMTTLQSFSKENQLIAPIVRNNAQTLAEIIETVDLQLDTRTGFFDAEPFIEQTIIGKRRELSDWWRNQLFGVMWAVTGIDQFYPDEYTLRSNDLANDLSWQEFEEPRELIPDDLAFDALIAGHEIVGNIPLLLINEPIFIADGENSDIRYNFWYPRWAYDQYRELYHMVATENDWKMFDFWNLIDPDEFTDSPVHLTPRGSRILSEAVIEAMAETIQLKSDS